MEDTIYRQAAIEAIHNADTQIYEGEAAVGRRNYMTKEEVCSIIDSLPSAQPSRELIEQIKWERDLAIQQLKDLGYGLGEKPKADGDVISKQAAIDALHMHLMYRMGTDSNKKRLDDWINSLPSAQPDVPDRNVGDINKRQSEIVRCKDCKNWDTTWQNDWAKNYHYCPLIDGTRNGDWYCADAERRTDE